MNKMIKIGPNKFTVYDRTALQLNRVDITFGDKVQRPAGTKLHFISLKLPGRSRVDNL